MDKEDGLSTTVVGSWPLSNTHKNMVKVFNDLIQSGIDYPCYPQLLSMTHQFLSPLSKEISQLEEIDGKFYLNEEFEVPEQPIALEYGEFIVNFFNEHPDLKQAIKGTKACLTGPFTLTFEIILKNDIAKGLKPIIFEEPRAVMVEWIVDKFAEIIKKIGTAYNDMGIEIISCDEPILGLLIGRKPLFHSEDFIIDTINKAISGIKYLPSIHVCGRISPFLRDLLLKTNVKILDHEFRTNEQNFKIFEKKHFQGTDKFLALGTVESKFVRYQNKKINDYVEDIEFLKDYISKGIERYGRDNLLIKPDCGFLPIGQTFGENDGYEIVIRKVKNMVLALKELK
jgi:methionine synthase II (cobalamin-independent)